MTDLCQRQNTPLAWLVLLQHAAGCEVDLAAQVVAMAVLSLCWLGVAALQETQQGAPVTDLWQGYGDPLAWLVLLWPALGQYSTGEAAQVAGQAK